MHTKLTRMTQSWHVTPHYVCIFMFCQIRMCLSARMTLSLSSRSKGGHFHRKWKFCGINSLKIKIKVFLTIFFLSISNKIYVSRKPSPWMRFLEAVVPISTDTLNTMDWLLLKKVLRVLITTVDWRSINRVLYESSKP